MFRSSFGVVALLVFAASASAQTPDYLSGGVARVQAGDFQLGIMMLNEVVASTADAATIARAHAYRAQGFLGLNRPADARAAALLALKADPNIQVTSPPYSSAIVEVFTELRRPASPVSPEVAAAAAEQQGRYQEAFAGYLSAYQKLPAAVPIDEDRRLREKIITVARKLDAPPPIPPDARAHFAKAQELIQAQAVLGNGGAASMSAAVTELQTAIRLAPWWPEATFQLATALQQSQLVDAALMNLDLYRLADPDGYAKAVAANAKPETPKASGDATASIASVYVYWPPQVRSTGAPKVYCDGNLVAELQKGRFVALSVPPGSHEIKVSGKQETFAFEPGTSYYVRASQEGFTRWSPFNLRLVDATAGAAEFKDKSITSNEARRTFTNQCAAPQGKRK